MKLLILAAGFVAGNFIWQAMTGQNWSAAFERSFFQAFVLFAAWMAGVAHG